MKRKIVLAVAIIITFVVSVIVHLPIQAVLSYVALPAPLSISAASGTLWQGHAQQVKWQRYQLGQISWQFEPLALLQGNAQAKVRFGRGSQWQLQGRGSLGYGLKGAYAENVLASLPMSEALKFAPPMPIPLDLNGQLELNIHQLTYAQPYCAEGKGNLVWNTDTIGTPLAPLTIGPVIAEITCQESNIHVAGSQQSPQVRSEFFVDLKPNRQYVAQAWFSPQAEMPNALSEQLKWLPKPDAQGRYQFNQQGRL